MAEVRKIGNFELLERVGQGGMGSVFKARQVSMDRIVALKILPPSLAKQASFTERFVREARASARLNHPNIVSGIDVGQDGGVYYFAMEFVDGLSGREVLAKGKLTEEQVLKIGRAMAQALVHAHAHGILHRDIKPDNILIDKSGTPKLCDLGLARLDTQSEAEKALTQEGLAVGSPHYISPEQARGMRDLDAKTDLYSLGATLYHMVTGKTMFEGATIAVVMTKHVTDKCPNPNDAGAQASKGLVAVLARLLTKDRADRYESAEKLLEDLDRVIQGKPPRNAELPPGKSPFLPSAAATVPVKKAGATAAVAPIEKGRTSRRDGRAEDAAGVARWLLPVGLAGAAVVVLLLSLGRSKPQPPAENAAASPPPPARTAVSTPAPRVPAPVPAVSRVPPKNITAPAVPKTADVVGLSRPEAPAPSAPPQVPEPAPAATASAAPAATAGAAGQPGKTDTPPAGAATVPGVGAATPQAASAVQRTDDASRAAPGPELAALIAKAAGLSVESKFREAAQLFTLPAAKLETLDAFDRELTRIHAAGYSGLADMKTLVADRLKADPNKIDARSVRPKALGGKLAGSNEKALIIKDKGVELQWKWEQLSLEELLTLNTLVLGAPPPDVSLGLSVAAYDQGTDKDDALARKALAGANSAEGRRLLELIVLRDKVTLAKKQAVQNAYAEKLFYEVDDAIANGKFTAIAAKVAALRARYADSDVMKQRGGELDDLVELLKVAQQAGAVGEPGNVALAKRGATCTGSPNAMNLIDGNTTEYDTGSGYAYFSYPGEFIVTLPKVYVLRQIRVLLWDGEDDRFYRFALETSHDGQKYIPLVDRSRGQWRSWQQIDFPPRPVKTIKLKGLFDSANFQFHAVELEAYCIPPDTPAKPKAGSQGPPVPRRLRRPE